MSVLDHERVGEAEHEGHVGRGPGRDPVRAQLLGQVVPQRADQHQLHAGVTCGPQGPVCVMA